MSQYIQRDGESFEISDDGDVYQQGKGNIGHVDCYFPLMSEYDYSISSIIDDAIHERNQERQRQDTTDDDYSHYEYYAPESTSSQRDVGQPVFLSILIGIVVGTILIFIISPTVGNVSKSFGTILIILIYIASSVGSYFLLKKH
jgi:hypothetical protein